MMHRGLWNMDHVSFFSEATLIEIGVYPRAALFSVGSLSTRVFETRTTTGSELFSLLICFHTTTFTLLRIFSPLAELSETFLRPRYVTQDDVERNIDRNITAQAVARQIWQTMS